MPWKSLEGGCVAVGFRVDAVCLCLAQVGLKREKKVLVGDARVVGQSWPEAMTSATSWKKGVEKAVVWESRPGPWDHQVNELK